MGTEMCCWECFLFFLSLVDYHFHVEREIWSFFPAVIVVIICVTLSVCCYVVGWLFIYFILFEMFLFGKEKEMK